MYQPIDSIVDFSQPLWSATKDTADQFMLNGKHYVAPLGYSASAMIRISLTQRALTIHMSFM